MQTRELDYDLPPTQIATQPSEPRDAARLMVIWRATGRIQHTRIAQLPHLEDALRPTDLLLFNQTSVLPAHFIARRASTGGRVRGLYLDSPHCRQWHVMLETRGSLQIGECIKIDDVTSLELLEPHGSGRWLARLDSPLGTLGLLKRIGTAPLPMYIRKLRRARGEEEVRREDAYRYNTIFAKDGGSVAAPTAALHFTDRVLHNLDARGIHRSMLTLHIGLGTFSPIRTDQIEDHTMHREWMCVPVATITALRRTRGQGGRIIPVGTTCVRAVESLTHPLPAVPHDDQRYTDLFIRPGPGRFDFRYTDALLTNFHLPRSTLLALVAALPGVGMDRLKCWYQIAIAEGYRFYSYGDAMLLL